MLFSVMSMVFVLLFLYGSHGRIIRNTVNIIPVIWYILFTQLETLVKVMSCCHRLAKKFISIPRLSVHQDTNPHYWPSKYFKSSTTTAFGLLKQYGVIAFLFLNNHQAKVILCGRLFYMFVTGTLYFNVGILWPSWHTKARLYANAQVSDLQD